MDERRSKGLCFWCDDKFVPGRRCQKKQIYVLTIDSDESDGNIYFKWEPGEDKFLGMQHEEPQLSLHATTGVFSYNTMRVRGAVRTNYLSILIDSGSSHNFLDGATAKKLG